MARSLHLLLLLLLILLPQLSFSQELPEDVPKITKDSLPLKLKGLWRYHPGDDPAWASPGYNDGHWVARSSFPGLSVGVDSAITFPGIGWFRTYVTVDSTLAGKPLGVMLSHDGAAEVWLDGQRQFASGVITPEGKISEGGQAIPAPAILIMPDTGRHLIAVRYADTSHLSASSGQHVSQAGFTMRIEGAERAISKNSRQAILITAVTIFYFSFFFAFALLHLFLFLYHRAGRSNLWFSLFCLGLGFLFLTLFLLFSTNSKALGSWVERYGGFFLAAICASISAFVNELFGWGRMRFRIAVVTLMAGVLCLFVEGFEDFALPVIIALVFIEVIVLIMRAIYRKVPGARIIGAGILLFALMVMAIFVLTLTNLEISVESSENRAAFLIVLLFLFLLILAIISIPLSMSAYLAWSFATVNKHLNRQLSEVERLSAEALEHEAEKQRLLETRKEELEQEVSIRTEELRGQKAKSDELLLNILPAEVADELKEKGSAKAKLYSNVSVLFTDFADFTQRAEKLSPDELVHELNECFSAFDDIITKHGLEKIKTVGDAYIAASGMPTENDRHAQDVVDAALEISAYMQSRKEAYPDAFGIRLGVHSGPLVAGIVGVKKFAYDIWGDTVNTAARMEQHSETGKINISAATYELVKDEFVCSYRGELEAKHKGRMGMYFVEGRTSPPGLE